MIGTQLTLEDLDDAQLYLTTSTHNYSFKLTLSDYNGAHNTVNIDDYQASIVDSTFIYKIPLERLSNY